MERGPLSQPKLGNGQRQGVFPGSFWEECGEEFRSLRTRVASRLGDEKHKTILVTSTAPREGKTVTATNLARSLAQASWRTLLVDGDMRAPDIHTLFQLGNWPGLSDLLRGGKNLEELRKTSDVEGLEIVTSGTRTNNPAELLSSSGLPSILGDLRARYDYVVLDSPPVLPVTDSLLLSRHVDGILFVLEQQVTPREVVKAALEQLKDRPILGLVVNGVSPTNLYYYGYGY